MEPHVGGLAAAYRSKSHVLPLADERMPPERGLNPNLIPFPRVQPYSMSAAPVSGSTTR